jgi:hypothetical protein
MGTVKSRKRVLRNPLRAIRAKCLECCGGSPKEVRLCTDTTCALHPFRKGHNPFALRRNAPPVSRRDQKNQARSSQKPNTSGPKEIQLSLLHLLSTSVQ